jgi:amino acid permease
MSSSDSGADRVLLLQLPHNIESTNAFCREGLYHVLLPHDPPEWALSGRIWISIFMVPLVPLCFLRSLHSLRHTSYTALFAVGMFRSTSVPKDDWLMRVNLAYLITIVVVCYISPPKGSSPPGEIHLIHFTSSFISTFPIQVFAYTCGQNVRSIFLS